MNEETNEDTTECYNCGETINEDDAIIATDTDNAYCQSCADDQLYECGGCGELVESTTHTEDTGNEYCDDCSGECHWCENCECYFENDYAYSGIFRNRLLCFDCLYGEVSVEFIEYAYSRLNGKTTTSQTNHTDKPHGNGITLQQKEGDTWKITTKQ